MGCLQIIQDTEKQALLKFGFATRNLQNILLNFCKSEQKNVVSSAIQLWQNLDNDIQNDKTLRICKN